MESIFEDNNIFTHSLRKLPFFTVETDSLEYGISTMTDYSYIISSASKQQNNICKIFPKDF